MRSCPRERWELGLCMQRMPLPLIRHAFARSASNSKRARAVAEAGTQRLGEGVGPERSVL